MKSLWFSSGISLLVLLHAALIPAVKAEDPYQFITWNVAYQTAKILGVSQQDLRRKLDSGLPLGSPDGVLINGKGSFGQGDYSSVTVDPGKTYRLRVSNVGTVSSINFRIQGHQLLLVETEGSHTNEILLDSLDVHVGQSYSVLVKTNQSPSDFYVVASTKFQPNVLQGVGILHYSDSHAVASGPIPPGPDPNDINFSMNQANTVRRNLTANAARPNPQGSYHYGEINVTRRIQLQNTAVSLNGHQRYAVNGISYLTPDTPLKLADYLNISGVFTLGSITDFPPQQGTAPVLLSSVFDGDWQAFIEIVFLNTENEVQSWHLDGHDFFVAGYGIGSWSEASRHDYNLLDGVSRSTTHVYPNGWTAILFPGDNAGMWNIRSQTLYRQYLGQEIYIRFYNPTNSFRTEAPAPANLIRCGRAA
ncbi:hypothetical protein O6H91_Y470800 [Diphasiastrum complanatum]|nr:hypothetical protein O6H91_Y470800 [Diphasiastrum complanatum]